ncbi:CDP-alcohol phosphatidyltransferase family protein, partial [Georgenia sp. 10Sc9-8]|nr:CDP-alcohol phosphatidyltransferase family protein [Georgenia halotolerans]
HLTAGALVLGALAATDSVDGIMARTAGRSSRWGAFLDSTLDRFSDAAIFCGVLVWALRHPTGTVADLTVGLAVACLVVGSVVPYARARAEGLGLHAASGIAERTDRLVVVLAATLLVGLGLPPLVMTVALGLLALASAVTVLQRMVEVRRQVEPGELAAEGTP